MPVLQQLCGNVQLQRNTDQHARNYQGLLVYCKPVWLWHISCDDACWKLALFQEFGQVLGTLCVLHKDDHLQFAQLSQVTSNLYKGGIQCATIYQSWVAELVTMRALNQSQQPIHGRCSK